jgi:hypothetical protein
MRPLRSTPLGELTPAQKQFFETGDYGDGGEGLDLWFWFYNPELVVKTWHSVRDTFVAQWITSRPGTRPFTWWQFSAPAEPVALAPGRLWRDDDRAAAHRRRLGGRGTPQHEAWGARPTFSFGIPTEWFTSGQVEYYNGRAVDVDGRLLGREFAGRPFAGVAPDAFDPPRFESEAAYLQRHGLLTKSERAMLTAADFEPTVLDVGIPHTNGAPQRVQ